MIAVDTSVFVAMAAEEPGADMLVRVLALSEAPLMSAGNYLECGMVAESRFGGRAELDDWVRRRRITVVPVDHDMAAAAIDAFRQFGKGRHRAGLNYGDCFAYALARTRSIPLLFKGDDFARTDVLAAHS